MPGRPRLRNARTWADVLGAYASDDRTARALVQRLAACETTALAFCRLLERWRRGDARPPTAAARRAALRDAAEDVAMSVGALAGPLDRFLLELEAEALEGRSWYGAPGAAELVDWQPVLTRAGVPVPAEHVAQAYLELAVLVRALEGLTAAAHLGAPPEPSSLWAGLFDLRDNLLGRALDDARAVAAA